MERRRSTPSRLLCSVALLVSAGSIACGHTRDAAREQSAQTTAAPVQSYGPTGSPATKAGVAPPGATPSGGATFVDPATRQRPTIRVLEAGAEPRRRLRYAFKTGRDEWMRFELKMAVTLAAVGRPSQKMESPVLAMTLRLRGEEVTPEGLLKGIVAVERVDVVGDAKRDPNVSHLQDEAAKLGTVMGRFVLSDRGEMSESEIVVPRGTVPLFAETLESLRDGLRSLYTPLPEEEVGRGAKWQVTSKQSMPAVVDVRTVVSLLDLDASKARVDMKSELSAVPGQNVAPPGSPSDVKMALDSLSGQGAGGSQFSFDRLAREGKSSLSVDVHVRALEQKRELTFQTHTEIETTYKPLAGAPAPRAPKK